MRSVNYNNSNLLITVDDYVVLNADVWFADLDTRRFYSLCHKKDENLFSVLHKDTCMIFLFSWNSVQAGITIYLNDGLLFIK